MKFEALELEGAWLVLPEPNEDERGYFARTFCKDAFGERGLHTNFTQHSTSFNLRRGTLRGLHYQEQPRAETKLVRCSRGSIFDVIVNIRPGSTSFGKWFGTELSVHNGKALYIPEGFAHGFITLEDETEVHYMISPAHEAGYGKSIRWDDPGLDIRWPLQPVIISAQDRNAASLVKSTSKDTR